MTEDSESLIAMFFIVFFIVVIVACLSALVITATVLTIESMI